MAATPRALPFIKVCGIRTAAEARGALRAGANAIGLLVGLTHLSEDGITPEAARDIVASLPPAARAAARTVMVTHLTDAAAIAALARAVGVTSVQIHGDLDAAGVAELRGLLPGAELIKAIHVGGEEALAAAQSYAPHADLLLLDSRIPGRLGGTGQTHDWALSRRIVEAVEVPVILAGGLNPDNVAQAIEAVRPAGIDANSGLEHPDGSKDFHKIERFAAAGRACRFLPRRGPSPPGRASTGSG